MRELQMKYEDDVKDLEEKWNSRKMMAKFNNPSNKLIRLKRHCQAQLKGHSFDQAAVCAQEIEKVEKEEAVIASQAMTVAFRDANERLKCKFLAKQQAIEQQHESRISSITTMEEREMRPIQSRMMKFRNVQNDRSALASRMGATRQGTRQSTPSRRLVRPTTTSGGSLEVTKKLTLPRVDSRRSGPPRR